MMEIEGSGSASGPIIQRHGSADPDPDLHQNVMDPQHCWEEFLSRNFNKNAVQEFYLWFLERAVNNFSLH
jgi:hypothetical protein